MLDDKGPLLYISSVSTNAVAHNQNTFDSRKENEYNGNFREMKKLRNIIEMYDKSRPVLCNLVTSNSSRIAIPYQLQGTKLYIKTQDGKNEQIDISNLQKIEIIRF